MSLEPKIFINYSNKDADSLEIAFSKYNNHSHSKVSYTNFYSYSIYPGDTVLIQSNNGRVLFNRECTVLSLVNSGLVLSQTANFSVVNGQAIINNVLYNNVNIIINSNLLTINQENGVLTASSSQYILSNYIHGTINYKLNGKVYLSLTKPYKSRLIKLNYYAKPSSINTPATLSLYKVDSSNNITTYFSDRVIVTNVLTSIDLPLNNSNYILNRTDLLYLQITNGISDYNNAINAPFPPLLDYELEEYILDADTIEIDNIAPSVNIVLSDYALKIGDTATITFTFSEPVNNFTVGDITAPNGTLSSFTITANPLVYTVIFTPNLGVNDNTNRISIGSNYTDLVGNIGTPANSLNYTIDTIAPSVNITLSDYALKIGDTAIVTFTFSEPITGFTIDDIIAPNGTLSNFILTANPLVYTTLFTPTTSSIEDSTNTIVVEANTYQDIAGNQGLRGESPNYVIDNIVPSVDITLSDYTLKIGDTATVTFTFNEPVSNFTLSDITVQNGTLSNFTVTANPVVYTALFTPTLGIEDNSNVITVNTQYADTVGNMGLANSSPNYTIDTIAPTVNIVMSTYNMTSEDTATITFTFSESITGFTAGDITAPNGTLSDFTVTANPLIYTATFTPTPNILDSTNTIVVEAGTYQDIAGNPGLRGESLNYSLELINITLDLFVSNDTVQNTNDIATVDVTAVNFTDMTSISGTITYDSDKWEYIPPSS